MVWIKNTESVKGLKINQRMGVVIDQRAGVKITERINSILVRRM